MAKKVEVIVKPQVIIVDCLRCKHGKLGAFNLINCDKTVTPQPNRLTQLKAVVFITHKNSHLLKWLLTYVY